MFRLAPEADISDTAYVDSVSLPPALLVARFGPPGRATADGKVSGRYVFTDERGNVFTVHDWKSTSLYLADEDAPTRDEFWADEEPFEFTIGGSGEENGDGLNLPAAVFRGWLLEQYRAYHSGLVN